MSQSVNFPASSFAPWGYNMLGKVRAFAAFVVSWTLLFTPLELSSQTADTSTTFCAVHHYGTPQTNDGLWPIQTGLIALAPDGSVWTTTNQGGKNGVGTIVKVTVDGTYSKVADFTLATTGSGPEGGLVYGNNGYMYGTTYGGGKWGTGTIFRVSVQGGDPEVIYDFRNGRPTGIQPEECPTPQTCKYSPRQRANFSASYPISPPVVVGGTLYGVTSYSNNQQYGTLYSIPLNTAVRSNSFTALTPEDGDNQFHVLCMFQPALANDPEMKPFACTTPGTFAGMLIAGHDGNLYGTTVGGYGTVFKATTGGAVTSLHAFSNTDGSRPIAITQASDGNLYGTTVQGGRINWGVVYKVDPRMAGNFSVLTDFPIPTDNSYAQGNVPYPGVVEGPDHYLYGALSGGGQFGRGLIYRIAMDGSGYAVVHDFDAWPHGRKPLTVPMIVGDTIYGSTYQGGNYDSGVIYRFRMNRVSVNGGLVLANDGTVEVHAPARATQSADPNQNYTDGITVRLKCDKDPHIVQFIYREIIQPYTTSPPPGTEYFPNGKLLDNESLAIPCCKTSWTDPFDIMARLTGIQYPITTLLTDIHWNPDAPAKPNPYFEGGHSAELDCDSLTLFDRPQMPALDFDLALKRVSRAVARDYAMCGGQVLRQINWISDQTMDAQQKSHWSYQAKISTVTKIPDYFLCLLQNKGYDLPTGQTITPGFNCNNLDPAIINKP